MHALVFWGFCIILFGSIEMVIDGILGTEKSLSILGGFYKAMMAAGDIFALLIAIAIVVFLARRVFLHIKRFEGIEMKRISHIDANVALTLILILMLSLMGMNAAYLKWTELVGHEVHGLYPVSQHLTGLFNGSLLKPYLPIPRFTGGPIYCSSFYLPIICLTPSISMFLCRCPMYSYRDWSRWVNYLTWIM
jgi:hypothetical protein